MKKIKTAIIGFGLSGSSFHAPFIENLEEFDLSAIVVRHVEAVREVRPNVPVYENLDILFANEPDIELIVISTPTPTHYEFAKQAILAGKHVIVEKPFVVSAEEGVELIELAKEYNVVLSVYQNRRWDGDFLTVQDIVQSGKLGRVHTVEMNWDRYRKEVRNRWKEKQAPGSGNFYDMAPHMLDQANVLFGLPNTIYGNLQKQRDGAQSTDYFHVVLEYDNASVLIRGGTLVAAETPRFVLHGTEASYILFGLDPQEGQLVNGLSPTEEDYGKPDETRSSVLTKADGTTEVIKVKKGNYKAYFEQIAQAIRNDGQIPVTADDGLQVIRLIEAGTKSFTDKKIVSLLEA